MSRRKAPLEINQFVGGFNSEENLLANNTQAEREGFNMVVQLDGSRKKRLGISTVSSDIDAGVPYASYQPTGATSFIWENAGNNPNSNLLVQQMGNSLFVLVYDVDAQDYLTVYSEAFDSETYSVSYSMSVLDGYLVVVTGEKEVNIYEYDGTDVTKTSSSLSIRDFFGVQVTATVDTAPSGTASVDLTNPAYLTSRPNNLPDTHIYNLRNSTYTVPRLKNNDETLKDPILSFYEESTNTKYPSYADSIIPSLYADTSDVDDRTSERFFVKNLFKNPPGTFRAPQGHFIIDAMERGVSRLARAVDLTYKYSYTSSYDVTTLPADTTTGGPKVVTDYAGRFWFGGFSGEVTGGDSLSPNLSSYILFSQVLQNKKDITRCYQEADPTSHIDPEIVDSDGGFIKLDGAYNIQRMEELDGDLFIFSEKGVWVVSGDKDQFSATDYKAYNLFKRGCVSPNSVVVVDSTMFFWGDSGVYKISRNQFNVWIVEDVTEKTIKTYYNTIDLPQKRMSVGYYDVFNKTIKWVFNTIERPLSYNEELHFSLVFNCFTKFRTPIIGSYLPKILSVSRDVSSLTDGSGIVTVDLEDVIVDGEEVTVPADSTSTLSQDTIYISILDLSTNIVFAICKYNNNDFYDWDDVGYDAYIESQHLSFGEVRSRKQTPYIYVFMKTTETGFNDDFTPINESSCLLSVQWDWANSSVSNKWSPERQVYRHKNMFMPLSADDPYDSGYLLINTRNRVRGSGQAASFRLASEYGKDLHLYGYAFEIESSEER